MKTNLLAFSIGISLAVLALVLFLSVVTLWNPAVPTAATSSAVALLTKSSEGVVGNGSLGERGGDRASPFKLPATSARVQRGTGVDEDRLVQKASVTIGKPSNPAASAPASLPIVGRGATLEISPASTLADIAAGPLPTTPSPQPMLPSLSADSHREGLSAELSDPPLELSEFTAIQSSATETTGSVQSVVSPQEPAAATHSRSPSKPNQDLEKAPGALFDQLAAAFELSAAEMEDQRLGTSRDKNSSHSLVLASTPPSPALADHLPSTNSINETPIVGHGVSGSRESPSLIPPTHSAPGLVDQAAQVQTLTPKPAEPLLPLPTARPLLDPAELAAETARGANSGGSTDMVGTAGEPDSESATGAAPAVATFRWPEPTWLESRISSLTASAAAGQWAQTTLNNLQALSLLESLSDPGLETILSQLRERVAESEEVFARCLRQAEEVSGSTLLRLRYDLLQTVVIWESAAQVAATLPEKTSTASGMALLGTAAREPSGQMVTFRRVALPDLDEHWEQFLSFDRLAEINQRTNVPREELRGAARQALTRLSSPVLTPAQLDFLERTIPEDLITTLQEWASEDIDLVEFLKNWEAYRSTGYGHHLAALNREYQNLLWSTNPAAQNLAIEIDNHLRNANFRMSISDRMLNSLLPPTQEFQSPVHDQVMGAEVRGQSRIANQLLVRLVPDSSRIHLRLESVGLVRSSTQASRSGFTVQNEGQTRFHAFKRFLIGQQGIETDSAQAVSQANNAVVGIGSNLDPIPVLGWVARRMAENQIRNQEPLTKRLVQNKVESEVKQKLSQEVDTQLFEMQKYLYTNLIEPLTILDLEPTPIEMRSTEDRMIMRYRLAGRDQFAAATTRPAGLDQSLMSMQIHESAINNLLNRMELNGNRFTAEAFRQHLVDFLGLQKMTDQEEVDVEANFEFSSYDPIRVSFADGKIQIELNLRRLQIGGGKAWKNLTASVRYDYQVQGTELKLVRSEEGVRLTGHRLAVRDQVAVRAIFTKLFGTDYQLGLLPATIVSKMATPLEVTQFDVVDGWVGISFDNAPGAPATAVAPADSSVPILRRQ